MISRLARGKIMTDEELQEAAPTLPVLYFDGFGNYKKVNGLLRCTGYTLGVGPQYNLVTSLAGADATNRIIRRILDERQVGGMINWDGVRLAPH